MHRPPLVPQSIHYHHQKTYYEPASEDPINLLGNNVAAKTPNRSHRSSRNSRTSLGDRASIGSRASTGGANSDIDALIARALADAAATSDGTDPPSGYGHAAEGPGLGPGPGQGLAQGQGQGPGKEFSDEMGQRIREELLLHGGGGTAASGGGAAGGGGRVITPRLGGVDEEGRYISLETQGVYRKKEEVRTTSR